MEPKELWKSMESMKLRQFWNKVNVYVSKSHIFEGLLLHLDLLNGGLNHDLLLVDM